MKRRTLLRQATAAILGLTICLTALPAFALSIKVLNGTRTAGRAAQVGTFLKKHGYPVSKVDKADKIFDSTVIYYKDGARDEAKKIADLMPATQSIKPLSWESQFDLIIVVGHDQPAAAEPAEALAEPQASKTSTPAAQEEPAPAPQPTAPPPAEAAPPESASGEVTATPPGQTEPAAPEVEGEREPAAPSAQEGSSASAEQAPPQEAKPAPPPAKPKPAAGPKPKATKPAAQTTAKAAPSTRPASKSASKASTPEPKPAQAGYAEIGVPDLLKQVSEQVGKNVRVQDEFLDQSNYFLGMKDHGIGPEEYVEFFTGESRVNLIIYISKSNRDALGTLNALKRGDKVVIHGKVFAKNPIGRPLLMADRLDRG